MSGVFDDHLAKFQAAQGNMTQNMAQLKELYTDTPEDRAGQINKAVQGVALAHNSIIGAYETGKAMYNNVKSGRLLRGLVKDQNQALHDKVSNVAQQGKDKLNDVLASASDKSDDIQGKAAAMVENQKSGDNAEQVTAIKETAPTPITQEFKNEAFDPDTLQPAAARPAAAAPAAPEPAPAPEPGMNITNDAFPRIGQTAQEDHSIPDLGKTGQEITNVVNKGDAIPTLATDDTKALTTANKLSKGLEEGGAFSEEFPIVGTSLEVLGGLTQLGSVLYGAFHKAPGPTTSIDVTKVSPGQIGGNFSQITGSGSAGGQSA